jgi:hypothetical protein
VLEQFSEKVIATSHKIMIRVINQIIDEYVEAGYKLTLRQLYYQLVARDIIENKQTEYKRIGNIVDIGRKGGLIDWDAIEDRTRNIRRINTWDEPEDAVQALAKQFKRDPWEEQTQKRRIEVWIEKDALVGVIEPVCNRFRIPYFSCRGYGSSSELYDAGKRLASYQNEGYECLVLHLGDHDPSGVQMTEDNERRINLYGRSEIEFRRIALTMAQVEEYNPPANFAKQTDSRTEWYVKTFGTEDAWELDALTPPVIEALIEEHVDPLINHEEWSETMKREAEDLAVFADIKANWKRTKAAPVTLQLLRDLHEITDDPQNDADPEESTVVAVREHLAELDD